MAVTKIWTIKDSLKCALDYAANPEKTTASDLEAVISYAMDGEKTANSDEQSCYVSGINCNSDTASEEMMNIKKLFGKTVGNMAYHCYQSFRPGEVTAEECHAMGLELARRMWGDRYQVLVATHLDKDHLHNHLVCNSVSFIDGMKFNCDKRAYRRLRALSDEICKENGFSVIENPRGKTHRQIYLAEKHGEPTKHNLMREAIDYAISLSTDASSFVTLMRKQGYIINMDENRKYATIRSVNSKKPTRMYKLGEDYDLPGIERRIFKQDYFDVIDRRSMISGNPFHPAKMRSTVYVGRRSKRKIGGLYGLYLTYCYLLGYLPKRSNYRPLSPEMREACRMCDKYSEAVRLMARHHIRTEDDVNRFIAASKGELDSLIGERSKIINKLRRAKDPDRIAKFISERTDLTERITKARKDIKTAGFILEHSSKVREEVRIEQTYRRNEHIKSREKVRVSDEWER